MGGVQQNLNIGHDVDTTRLKTFHTDRIIRNGFDGE